MSFFKRIASLFSGRSTGDSNRLVSIYALSHRCKEPVAGKVDLYNELSGSDEEAYTYYCRKVLHTSGQNRCFAEVEFQLWFDKGKQIVHHEVKGGRWLSAEEYEEELFLFNRPDEQDADEEGEDEQDAVDEEAENVK